MFQRYPLAPILIINHHHLTRNMSTALISTATPITSFSPQEIIDQLRAENDHLQATLNNSHARFGSISADYTGSRFIPPWSDVKKFYEYQHEMNAIRTALQRAPAGLLPHEPIATLQADPYGGYYQWPTPTPHGLQVSAFCFSPLMTD